MKQKNKSRESFIFPEEEIEDYTGNGPWERNGEIYEKIDSYLTDGDGEWYAVIVKRKSDGKFFEFDWGYGDTRDYYEELWTEVFPLSVTRYE